MYHGRRNPRLETAEIAIKGPNWAFGSIPLHTNDAPQTLTRLVDMGVQAYAMRVGQPYHCAAMHASCGKQL